MVIKQRGFSLIEVMFAFAIIGISALGLVKLQTYMEQRADFAQHSVTALNLAEQKLEWFRTRGASAATSSLVANYPADFTDNGEETIDDFYTLEWRFPLVQLSGALQTVEVEASWEDRLGQKQSLVLTTMIAQYSEFD